MRTVLDISTPKKNMTERKQLQEEKKIGKPSIFEKIHTSLKYINKEELFAMKTHSEYLCEQTVYSTSQTSRVWEAEHTVY